MIEKEKLILTGASGFVGSHLTRCLEGEVITIPHKDISLFTLSSFDRLFFLSAYGNMAFHEDDDKIIQANLLDLVSMASQAKEMRFKSFIYISTSSVKLKYQTLYSRTKRAAEEVLLALTEKHNLPFCVVRPTSIYGPHEQPQHLIPTILRSCFEGEEMNFVREPTHDFVFVDDVVEAILNLSSVSAKGIFEVGTGIKTSNQEILETIEEITGKKAKINVVSRMRNYDNEDWVCKNYRARSFGWEPKISLRQGLEEVVEDYKKNPKFYEK